MAKNQIKLAGKNYTLEFNFLAYGEIKDQTGLSPFGTKFSNALEQMDPKVLSATVYAGLLTNHPDIELRFVQINMKPSNVQDIVETTVNAFMEGMPDEQGNAGGASAKKKPQKTSTQKSSGR